MNSKLHTYLDRYRTFLPEFLATIIAVLWIAGTVIDMRAILSIKIGSKLAPQIAAQSETQYMAITEINRLHLFGKPPAPAVVDPANLPSTELNLKIAGIFSSTQSSRSRAVIAENGKPAATYSVGDKISDQATIHDIAGDFVVIQRGERLEKLQLHKSSAAQSLQLRRIKSAIPTADQSPLHATTTETSSATMGTPDSHMTPQDYYRQVDARIAEIRKQNAAK